MAKYQLIEYQPVQKFVVYEPRVYLSWKPEIGLPIGRYNKLIEACDVLNEHLVMEPVGKSGGKICKVAIYKVVVEDHRVDETLRKITEISSMICEVGLIRKKRKK